MYKAYAGIGSQKTPDDICQLMTRLATKLESLGYTLRSGHARGADVAFEAGVESLKEIYIPWNNFNGSKSKLIGASVAAFEMAKQFHPNWAACSSGARALHARNCYQALGGNLDSPAEFVVCWTRNGQAVGGTGQALRIAEAYNIPIFNMYYQENVDRIIKFIEGE